MKTTRTHADSARTDQAAVATESGNRGELGIQPALLTTAQAAKLAGVGTRTWWRWTNSGLAPAPVRIGLGPRAAVRYRREEIEHWIAEGCPSVGKTAV